MTALTKANKSNWNERRVDVLVSTPGALVGAQGSIELSHVEVLNNELIYIYYM